MGPMGQLGVDQLLVMLREAIRAEEVAKLQEQPAQEQDPTAPAGGNMSLDAILANNMNSRRGY